MARTVRRTLRLKKRHTLSLAYVRQILTDSKKVLHLHALRQ